MATLIIDRRDKILKRDFQIGVATFSHRLTLGFALCAYLMTLA